MPIDNILDEHNSYSDHFIDFYIMEHKPGEKTMRLNVMKRVWEDAQEVIDDIENILKVYG